MMNDDMFRWYTSDWGRYTQADPLGVAVSDANLYVYAGNDPVDFIDPSGQVKIRHTITRRGTVPVGAGSVASLQYAKLKASGKCVGCGNRWHIELTLDVDHGYYCRYAGDCVIERWHANIQSAFVSKWAQQWHRDEERNYEDKGVCEAMAYAIARNIESDLLNRWPDELLRDYIRSQDCESTHHGSLRFLGRIPRGVLRRFRLAKRLKRRCPYGSCGRRVACDAAPSFDRRVVVLIVRRVSLRLFRLFLIIGSIHRIATCGGCSRRSLVPA
jgi:hypothetical protein